MKFQNMNRLGGAAMLFFTLLPASWAQSVTDSAAQTSSPVQPGAVVEKVERHSEAEKAGLRSGDVLLAWTRGESTGAIESPFDVSWTENEQAPLGLVKIQGLRGAEKQVWSMGPDFWGLTTRPNFTGLSLKLYSEGQKLAKTGQHAEIMKAARQWQGMAHRYSRYQPPWLEVWLFFHTAEVLREAKQWKEADSAYTEAERLAGGQQNTELRAKILIQLFHAWGNAFTWRQDLESSARYYERAITECRNLGAATFDEALNFNSIGSAALSRGDLDGARQSFSQALALLQDAAPRSLLMANTLNGFGNVAWNQGDLDKAESYHRRAYEIRQAIAPGSALVARSLNNLALDADQRGDLAGAEGYLKRALEIQQGLDRNSVEAVLILNNLGEVVLDRGDSARADEYLHQALRIVEQFFPGSLDVALTLHNLGEAAQYRGDHVAAERYLRQALLRWKKLVPGSINMALSLEWLGSVLRDQGDARDAEVYLDEAIAIFQKLAPESLRVAEVLDGLATVLIDRDVKKAEELARHALAIREKLTSGSPAIAGTLTTLGDLARRKGGSAEAEADYRQAIAIQEKLVPGTLQYADSLVKLANVMGQQQFEAAAQLYEKALTALEGQTARLGGSEETRSVFHATHANIYREYADLLLAQKQTGQALEVLERSRTRVLLAMLLAAHIDIHEGADPSLLGQERSLQTMLAAKSARRLTLLGEKNDEKQAAAITRETEDLDKRYQEVEERLRLNSPGYAALTQPQPLTAGEIQQLLDPDTVLLEYALGKERSYLWAVSQTSIQTYQLPPRSEIEQTARQLYQLLSAGSTSSSTETSQAKSDRAARLNRESLALSRMILAPAAEAIQGKRLLLVSEGALQYTPFGVLPDPGTASTGSSKQDPLLVGHEIVSLPSASVLAVLRRQEQNRPRPPKTVAVLADPVFETDDERVSTQQPHGSGHPSNPRKAGVASERLTRSVSDVSGTSETEIYLPRLPFTRREAHAILELTPPGQGTAALDFAASRKQAMSPELAQYRFVHIATHGLLDSEHPEFSGLVLSLVDRRGKWQDGFLSLEDVYNLNLPVDLVVLSGCKTGLGKEINGEGLIGLTRGFMYAGASRVIASTWAADDVATAELMAAFYKAMEQEKLSPAAALRQAQLEMRRHNRWRDPYYWAGFQIQGEWK